MVAMPESTGAVTHGKERQSGKQMRYSLLLRSAVSAGRLPTIYKLAQQIQSILP